MVDKKAAAVLLLALAAVILLHQQSRIDHYTQWKGEFGVNFAPSEDNYRRHIFLSNLKNMQEHNSDPSQTYKMGLNQFSALSDAEFAATYLRSYQPRQATAEAVTVETLRSTKGQVDWTERGEVSPVKNQGSCGSCWAFSAVAVLQSWALRRGQTVDLSEQQLVDCSHLYGNLGCDGGFNVQGLAYVRDHGITDTASYPYTAKNGQCKIHGGSFKINNIHSVVGCKNLEAAILERPVGVGVDAANWSRYASGIFSNCGKHLDHNVLLVGITSTYYKIKNSWSTAWGEKGFIRLALGNTCGICEDFSPWVS